MPPAPVLTLLGTGTLMPDAGRGSACHHLCAGDVSLLMDCGAGALGAMAAAGVPWDRLTHVVLSHYHTDHTGALAPLLWALAHGCDPPRAAPLEILGPPGLTDLREGLARAHGDAVRGGRPPVLWREVSRHADLPAGDDGSARLRLRTHPTPHTDHSVAWRLEIGGRAVAYTGDTGPSPELYAFVSGCDVVVCECAAPDERPRDGHMTPGAVAALARRARPGCIVVTHVYPPHDPDALAAAAARRAGGVPVVAGRDGMRIVVDGAAASRLAPARRSL